jgi:hypothetical protein
MRSLRSSRWAFGDKGRMNGAPPSGAVSKWGRQVSRCQVRGRLRAEGYPEPAYDEVIRASSVRRSSSGGLLIGLVPAFLESFLPG